MPPKKRKAIKEELPKAEAAQLSDIVAYISSAGAAALSEDLSAIASTSQKTEPDQVVPVDEDAEQDNKASSSVPPAFVKKIAEEVKLAFSPSVEAKIPTFPANATLNDKFRVPALKLKSDAEFTSYFCSLATWVLHHTVIVAGATPYRFLEVEFYHNVAPHHDDIFAHGDEVQRHSGLWYFHKRGKGYVGGSRKGLDIATGDEKGGQGRGGMLIRAIQNIHTGESIVGPCKSVEELLKVCKFDGIPALVDKGLKGDLNVAKTFDNKPLYLVEVSSAYDTEAVNAAVGSKPPAGLSAYFKPTKSKEEGGATTKKQKSSPSSSSSSSALPTVYCSPRVGLHLTKTTVSLDHQSRFVYKPYRFFVQPQHMSKKHLQVIWLYAQSDRTLSAEKLAQIVSGQKHHISGYLKEFHTGFDNAATSKLLQTLTGRQLSDKEVCQCFGALVGRGQKYGLC